MKVENIIVAIVAGIGYNISVLDGTPFPYGVIAALIFGGVITGIIMIFKKDRSNWSSVFMWSTIIISIVSGLGNNLNQVQYLNKLFLKAFSNLKFNIIS